ncbi:uncharacterized protein LOC135462119 isoform X2 [Liolophura sinensis]|uniref:uncharacterized protein LOC135462119 isoform X2 n=1 Tax=Liolophura sinensis TaxID=3198878 RepID=UPI0031591B4A
MLSAIGVVLCIPAIVVSVLYITQEHASDLPYKDYDIAGGVCSCVELVSVLGALIITVVGIQDFGNHSGGGSLEMGNGRPEPRDSPKRPPSDISRKDVNVDMKQRGGQGRGSPRKNSVEPVEKKAKVAAMAVSAPAPRKLPPMPQVDVNSQVRAMKKKKKRKKNLPENVE